MNAVDDVQADVDAKAAALSTLENQLATTPDSDVLWLEVQSAREAHASSDAQLRAAEAEADAAHDADPAPRNSSPKPTPNWSTSARRPPTGAPSCRPGSRPSPRRTRPAPTPKTSTPISPPSATRWRTASGTPRRRLDDARRVADGRQQAWWDAKGAVDQKVNAFDNRHVTTTTSSDGGTDDGWAAARRCRRMGDTNVAESSTSGQRTRPAPVASTSANTMSTDTASTDTGSAEVDTEVDVPTELDNQLAALTADAMENASPLMRQVETALRCQPGHLRPRRGGAHLLHASVVLDTRANEIAGMIDQHGLEAVARAFNNRFERPIIEQAQLQAFQGPDGPANFQAWAHGLWDAIGNLPEFGDAQVEQIFNHDKGYNRANNFAREAALAAVMGNPALEDAIARPDVAGRRHREPVGWVFQVLSDAGIIDGDGSDAASRFDAAVRENRDDLARHLGGAAQRPADHGHAHGPRRDVPAR